jgi:pimeloyl-ACP methyl ester carboxylesterase
MQWRKAAAVGGAAIGAAALYNVAAARGGAPLDNSLGGEPGEILWRGHRVAFTRHGQGAPVLLVHGIHAGASSFEWRHTVPALAERHSVIALDLLGFGRSDRPSLRYTPGLYQALLADVVARVAAAPCAVVASSLSAAHLVALAARDSRHFAALALIAPTGVAHLRDQEGAPSGMARALLDAAVVGDALYVRLTSPASVRRVLERIYADDRLVTRELVEHYVRSARQPGGKHAVSAFLGGRLNADVRGALRRVRQPALLLWGALARQNPIEHAHAFRVLKRDLEWTLVPDAGDLPHDERPAEVNAALLSFLERARRSSGSGGPRLAMA